MTKISIVVAMANNRAIGKNNQLLWHLPADLKHFKQLTTGHTIIMGRKTYASIGKPLPNRHNIVITRNPSLQTDGITVVNSLEDAFSNCQTDEEIFVIGGAEIYKQALPFTTTIHLTTVHQAFEGDALFPELAENEWKAIAEENHQPDEKNALPYTFSTLKRI